MDGLAQWLSSISWPLITRVLSAAGIGTVTYVGAGEALNAGLDVARNAFAGLTGDLVQILALSGFFDAMAITAGSVSSALAWMVLKHYAVVATGN